MDRKSYWTVGMWLALAAMIFGGFTGCKGVMQDDGKVVFSFATSLTMEQTGPKETDKESSIGIVLDPWLEAALKRSLAEYFGIDSDGDGVIDQSGVPEDATTGDPADVDGADDG